MTTAQNIAAAIIIPLLHFLHGASFFCPPFSIKIILSRYLILAKQKTGRTLSFFNNRNRYCSASLTNRLTSPLSAFPFTLGISSPITFPISFTVEAPAAALASSTIFLIWISSSCSGR